MKKVTYLLLTTLVLLVGCSTTTPEQREAERQAKEQRHAAEERRHAEEALQHKFARYSTAELKLMYANYCELRKSSGRDIDVTLNQPLAREIWGTSDSRNEKRILEVERELLRRWKAGDSEAYLPEFASLEPATQK